MSEMHTDALRRTETIQFQRGRFLGGPYGEGLAKTCTNQSATKKILSDHCGGQISNFA